MIKVLINHVTNTIIIYGNLTFKKACEMQFNNLLKQGFEREQLCYSSIVEYERNNYKVLELERLC